MLDAREIKTADEIELMKQTASLADAVHDQIARAIRPGTKESDLVAIATYTFFKLGAERVSSIQAVSRTPRPTPFAHSIGSAHSAREIWSSLILSVLLWAIARVITGLLFVGSRITSRKRPTKGPRSGSVMPWTLSDPG